MNAAAVLSERNRSDYLANEATHLTIVDDRVVREPAQPAPLVLTHSTRHVLAARDFLEGRVALGATVSLAVTIPYFFPVEAI